MLLDTLATESVASDDRVLLDSWSDLVSALVGERPAPDARITFGEMTARLDRIREQGWLELAVSRDVSEVVFFEAIKRLHRRDLPLPVPVLEIWAALRLLSRLAPSNGAAASLLGRALAGAAVPLLATDALFAPSDARGRVAAGWIPFGEGATIVLPVRDGANVVLQEAPPSVGLRTPAPCPDPTLPAMAVELGDLAGTIRLGSVGPAELDALRAEVLVAHAAALTGQAQALFSSTVAYTSVREQFGVPIGSFQALRHRCADLAAELHAAQQLTLHAADTLATAPEPLALGCLAKAFAGATAIRVASEAIQLRGGMGFTWEGGTHFGLKRCMYLSMSGSSVADCEVALGRWAVAAPRLQWAGGLEKEDGRPAGEAARAVAGEVTNG